MQEKCSNCGRLQETNDPYHRYEDEGKAFCEECNNKREKLGEIVFNIWAKNFTNSKKFFESKGNFNTKSKLKTKWHDEFMKDMNNLLLEFRNQAKKEGEGK